MEKPLGWGADLAPQHRPGVPRERPGAFHARRPVPQPLPDERLTRRVELERFPPVFGTAQPPRGVSGVLRRIAYRIPEHKARRWLLLIAADQVDVVEHGPLGKLFVGGIATTALLVRIMRGSPRQRRALALRWAR